MLQVFRAAKVSRPFYMMGTASFAALPYNGIEQACHFLLGHEDVAVNVREGAQLHGLVEVFRELSS